jgi:hypothetical protein
MNVRYANAVHFLYEKRLGVGVMIGFSVEFREKARACQLD